MANTKIVGRQENDKIESLFNGLIWLEKDAIYRKVRYLYVCDDVVSLLEDTGYCYQPEVARNEGLIHRVAERYVYEGDYDCNISYWDNLQHLIDDELHLLDLFK